MSVVATANLPEFNRSNNTLVILCASYTNYKLIVINGSPMYNECTEAAPTTSSIRKRLSSSYYRANQVPGRCVIDAHKVRTTNHMSALGLLQRFSHEGLRVGLHTEPLVNVGM